MTICRIYSNKLINLSRMSFIELRSSSIYFTPLNTSTGVEIVSFKSEDHATKEFYMCHTLLNRYYGRVYDYSFHLDK
jgi:hypothetical protein